VTDSLPINMFPQEVVLPNAPPSSPHLNDMSASRGSTVRVLIVVEGTTDVEFLQNISAVLAKEDQQVPNLAKLAATGQVVFLPFGGGNVAAWRDRLQPLEIAEFHLYDGELPPETAVRQRAAALVNARPNCRAAATSKRSLENYLHPQAIHAAGGPVITIGDTDEVGMVVAQAYHYAHYSSTWHALRRRQRRALVHKTKRWLATVAVRYMTPDLLAKSDPASEVRAWLAAIGELGRFETLSPTRAAP
jgi:putative ATP-dependent endonuclease of OLD family